MFWLFTDVALAQTAWEAIGKITDTDNKWEAFITAINILIQLLGVFLSAITYLSAMFLSPEWYNGSIFWLSGYFKNIWILVSNLVYFVFAFILIWIAFMNILWKTWDQYQLKQALPKFIVWVLIVPFSWFLVQFILSISAILTVSALSLPFDTFKDYNDTMVKISIPNHCNLDLSSLKSSWNEWSQQTSFCKGDSNVQSPESIDSIFWIISLYVYWVLSFDSFDDFSKKFAEETASKTLLDIVVKILFSAVFVLVYSVLIITLGIVLMIRWIYIWLYIMLSPVFWLMYFFGKSDWWSWFFEKFNIKEFFALAMVPVYTMLALSFWLLFIYITWKWLATPLWEQTWNVHVEWNRIHIWSRTLTITWAISNTTADDITKFVSVIEKEWWWSLWVIWTLILKIFGIVILWWTIMAAMRASKITEQITQPIYDFWTQVWKIAASAPWNIPIFWGQSMKSMSQAASSVHSTINQRSSTQWSDLANKFMKVDDHSKAMSKYMQSGDDNNKKKEAIDYVIKNVKNANSSQIKDFNKLFSSFGYKWDTKLLESDSERDIAIKLDEILSDNNITFSGKSSNPYKTKMLENRIISSDSGTAPVWKEWVWDNTIIDRDLEYFNKLKEPDEWTMTQSWDFKMILEDKTKSWTWSIFINNNWKVKEHTFEIDWDITDTFENLSSNDRKEIIDFYNNLKGDQKTKVAFMLNKIWVWDWDIEFQEAIEKEARIKK